MSIPRGSFQFVKSQSERKMLEDAFQAMERVQGSWEYLARPDVPSKDTGFMFSKDSTITLISNEVDKNGEIGHSGSSYGWTMRQMEFIAKNGWDAYVSLSLEAQRKRESEQQRTISKTY